MMGREGLHLTACCRLAAQLVLAAVCFSTVFSLAETTLPAIAANANKTPAGQWASGVFTLHLELRKGTWHPEALDGRGIPVYAFAEEGHQLETPGPLIRIPQDTELRVSVHNLLGEPAFVYGLHPRPGKSDNALELAAGETKEVRFPAVNPAPIFTGHPRPREDSTNACRRKA